MTINYYFRAKTDTNFSIENVFDTVIEALPKSVISRKFFAAKNMDARFIFSCQRSDADLHHITGAVNYVIFGLPRERTILTIHDVGHYSDTLKGVRKWLYGFVFLRLPLKKAKWITVISDFTKTELVRHFGVAPQKIHVVPNPVPLHFRFSEVRKKDQMIILQVGGGKNKNVEMLIQAVEGLGAKLLLVRRPDEYLIKLLTEKCIDYEFRYNLSAPEMQKVYEEADIVYFVSTYEGFGMPLIEAQTVGRPVIISAIASLKAIAKNDSALVSAIDVPSIRKGILKLMEDEFFRADLIQRGLRNAADFTAAKIAEQYLGIYKMMLNC